MAYAKRTDALKPESAFQVLAQAQSLEAKGQDIIHFEVGQPDFDTFANISLAGIQAIATGKTRYNPPTGIPELREAIADEAGKQRDIPIHPDQVVVSPGAKPNLFFPILALVEAGDEVVYPDPGFPSYRAIVDIAGGVPVPVRLGEEQKFSFDLGALTQLVNDRTKVIIINSPSNPTGGVLTKAELEHIAKIAQKYGCWILSDEIYSRTVYDGVNAPSIASISGMAERTVVIDGFSKTYAMTGWRLGFGIMPKGLASRVELLLTHSIGCTAHFTQYAGLEALRGPQEQSKQAVDVYRRKRDLMVAGLNEIPGIKCQNPQGAFYAFPNIKDFGKTSEEIAKSILDQMGVAVLPGSSFGRYGEGFLRFSYATSMELIREGLERIRDFFEGLPHV